MKKTLDDLFEEAISRNLYVSNIYEALSGELNWRFTCSLKHRESGQWRTHTALTLYDAVSGALAQFGPGAKPKAVVMDEFEDLL